MQFSLRIFTQILLGSIAIAFFSGCQPGRPAGEHEPAPTLVAEGWLNGTAPSWPELAGRVVVLDAWAYWCGPCRAEAPKLVQAYRQYKDRGVAFIGLTAEGGEHLVESREFLDAPGITWPNGFGAGQTLAALGVRYLPSLFVVDRRGRIVWRDEDGGSLEAAIEAALAEGEKSK